MLYEIFNMAKGDYTGYTAETPKEALILAAETEYGVSLKETELVEGRFSFGFRDLATLKK